MSHSKRNTSRAVFTAHERSLAKAAWTVSSARLTRESFLPFGACVLCLEPAQDPVACPAGDVFCRECALRNLLAQKQERQRLQRLRAQAAREHEERRLREDAEDEARAVVQFDLVQAGLAGGGGGEVQQDDRQPSGQPAGREKSRDTPVLAITAAASGNTATTAFGNTATTATTADPSSPTRKRKFELDDGDLQRVVDADRARARRAIEADRVAARDASALPSFWAPSETPSSNRGVVSSTSTHGTTTTTACPASNDGHALSLRTLVSLQFAEDDAGRRICPACKRSLSNASRAVMATPCGHVLCRSCVHQFVSPIKAGNAAGAGAGMLLHDPHASGSEAGVVRCYVCEADLTEQTEDKKRKKHKEKERIRPGLVQLRSEGTGFSAGGASEVKKNGVAFQC